MSTPDEHARAYIAAQALRKLDRWARGVSICGHCGGEYTPDLDGRQRHRQIIGHTPTRDEEAS